ncbi:hypothetical protein PG997_003961 [Apiospora hydei]|uniref:Uncharacterized protein n=1 Tax=Apiospora hydei TaxID=1337664 RepID=A0ABR1X0Q6_9PEZI
MHVAVKSNVVLHSRTLDYVSEREAIHRPAGFPSWASLRIDACFSVNMSSGEAKNTGTAKPLPQTSAGLAKLAMDFIKTGARPPDKKPDEDEDDGDDAANDGRGTRNSNEQFI